MINYLLILIAGLAWNTAPYTGFMAPLLAVLMPALVANIQSPRQRYARAFVYFLSATVSIIPSTAGFYGGHAHLVGVALWILLSLILAAPYLLAKGGLGAIVAVMLQAIPPVGLVSVVTPLSAAGVLFPNTGFTGVVLTLAVIYITTNLVTEEPRCRFDKECLVGLAWAVLLFADAWLAGEVAHTGVAPVLIGWEGVNTQVKPAHGNFMTEMNNINKFASLANNVSSVVVFPEAILDDAMPGTIHNLQSRIPKNQTWLVGIEDGKYDATYAITHDISQRIFASVLPMPLSMWRPGSKTSYTAAWHEPVQVIEGRRVWAAICFEQVLPWAWFDAMLQQPDVVLLQSNAWWAGRYNPAPAIQAVQARAWVRLMGVASISANNVAALK